MVDFIGIYDLCARKAIIEAAKRIINSDKVCHSYSDLNVGVTVYILYIYIYICIVGVKRAIIQKGLTKGAHGDD